MRVLLGGWPSLAADKHPLMSSFGNHSAWLDHLSWRHPFQRPLSPASTLLSQWQDKVHGHLQKMLVDSDNWTLHHLLFLVLRFHFPLMFFGKSLSLALSLPLSPSNPHHQLCFVATPVLCNFQVLYFKNFSKFPGSCSWRASGNHNKNRQAGSNHNNDY